MKLIATKSPLHTTLIIDFKLANESLKRSKVLDVMKDFAIPAKLRRLVMMSLQESRVILCETKYHSF